MTTPASPRRVTSLRVQLPLLLLLYCSAVALVLYAVTHRVQEARFERDFERQQLLRATEIQSRTERAAERAEIETGQREFGELRVFEEVRAAVFVSPQNEVVLSSRREWIGRRLDLAAFDMTADEAQRVDAAMTQARRSGHTVSQLSLDRRLLTIVMPAALPLGAGDLRFDRRALIVLVYDLGFAKSVNSFRLRQQFAWGMLGAFPAALGLGIALHVFVTRRIERLHQAIARFAAGESMSDEPAEAPGRLDEISEVQRHFTTIAASVGREIAVRRDAERALESSEALLRQLIKHTPAAVAMFDTEMRYIEASDRWLADYHLEGQDIIGRSHYDVFPKIPQRWKEIHVRVLAGAVERAEEDLYPRANGVLDWIQWEARPWRRPDGTIGGIIIFAQLITARKRVEQELRESVAERQRFAAEVVSMNERYARQEAALTTLTRSYVGVPDDFMPIVRTVTEVTARTLEVAHVGVWRHDNRGTSIRCDDLFEWPEGRHSAGAELRQEDCHEYFLSLTDADVMAVVDAVGDPRTSSLSSLSLVPPGVTSMMSVTIRSHGAVVGVLSCTHTGDQRRWTPDEQTFALAVANLLSAVIAQVERLQLEQQLRQAQRLEAIGQLAGGVAHDFNNILTVILGRAEEAMLDARVPADLRDAVAEISQNAERATGLTRQLLAFSRRQPIQMRDVDFNSVVGNLARMLSRILGEDVVVDFTYASEPTHVRADAGMIEQVLLNLAVNARDAMPLGGHLAIETSIDERSSKVDATGVARSWVCLAVTDTGSGIASEHLPHIFEPFFTTKDVGKGTGLGLATSYGIVQQHGGWIDVASELGRGTSFRVYFPRVVVGPGQDPTTPHPSASPRGTETILVVEDEDGVRALVMQVLQDLGYHVLEAHSGPNAIEVWLRHGQKIDMLITDIVMPDGMNGVELAERLRRSAPELKVIYTSGYMADINREGIPSGPLDVYLPKPFSLPELARLVRRTLDAAAPASGR